MTGNLALSSHAPERARRVTAVIIVAYLALTALIVAFSQAQSFVEANRYGLFPALAFLEHGAFVQPGDPQQPYTAWPPGFPLFMVPYIWMEGGKTFYTILATFVALHLAMGFVVRRTVEYGLPSYGNLALALVLFNPNALAAVHTNQTDHLAAAFLTFGFAAAVLYARRAGVLPAVLVGLLLSLATLTRPAVQYLIPLLILALPLLSLVSGRIQWRRDMANGIAAFAVAMAVTLPWIVHMHKAGEGFKLSSHSIEALALLENAALLNLLAGAFPEDANFGDSKGRMNALQDAHLRGTVPEWEALSSVRKAQLKKSYIYEYLATHVRPWTAYVKITALSWGRTLLSGGEGDLHAVFGLGNQQQVHPVAFYGIKVLALAFSVTTRILGVLGLVELIRRREYGILLLVTGLVGYMMLLHLGVGRPRFRVSVEAPLMLAAVYGIAWLRSAAAQTRKIL